MSIVKYCINDLEELSSLLAQLNIEVYTKSSVYLSNATIGQHTRHIIEFYECLLLNKNYLPVVDYDARKRSKILEVSSVAAHEDIKRLISFFSNESVKDSELLLKNNFCSTEEQTIHSSYNRELVYCLEHSIHHKALIKVVLIENQLTHLVESSFGVAPSTIKNRLDTLQDT